VTATHDDQELEHIAAARGITLRGRVSRTRTSSASRGRLRGRDVYLKVLKRDSDEHRAARLLRDWRRGPVAEVVDDAPGVQILAWIEPGTSLRECYESIGLVASAQILGEVATELRALHAPDRGYPDARSRGRALLEGPRPSCIDEPVWQRARRLYSEMSDSQTAVGVVHGDLHHSNVLSHRERGWVAIDPKGVMAEIEFELACALRNPIDLVERWGDARSLELAAAALAAPSRTAAARIVRWSFAQCVLTAAWEVEDGEDPAPWITAARAYVPLVAA
jgi:streptomycin 6-kinase